MMAMPRNDAAELLAPPKLPNRKLTFEEYLAWESENQAIEWVDGEVKIMPPASVQREDLVAFLGLLLRMFVKKHDLGKVLGSRIAMKLEAQRRGREPDLLFSDGRYHVVPLEAGGIFRSQVIAGFWLRVEWLWQLPDEMDTLRELGIV